jgi:hypothetical protein
MIDIETAPLKQRSSKPSPPFTFGLRSGGRCGHQTLWYCDTGVTLAAYEVLTLWAAKHRKLGFAHWSTGAICLLRSLVPAAPYVGRLHLSAPPLGYDLHHFVLSTATFRPSTFPLRFGVRDVLVCVGCDAWRKSSFPPSARIRRTLFVHSGAIPYVSWCGQFHCVRAILYRSASQRDGKSGLVAI